MAVLEVFECFGALYDDECFAVVVRTHTERVQPFTVVFPPLQSMCAALTLCATINAAAFLCLYFCAEINTPPVFG